LRRNYEKHKNCKGVRIFNANDTDIRIQLLRNATENLSRKPLWEMELQVSVILREAIIIKVRRRAEEGVYVFLHPFVSIGLPINLQSSKSPHQSFATGTEKKEEHKALDRMAWLLCWSHLKSVFNKGVVRDTLQLITWISALWFAVAVLL